MKSWLLRGLLLAFLMVVIRLIQGVLVNTFETQAALIGPVLQLIFALVPLVWGYIDGRNDAASQPDPDRRADLAITWLLAGLVAGILAGAAIWFVSLFYKGVYQAGFLNELTVTAAYTSLLVFLMAMVGVGLGRFLVDRRYRKQDSTPRGRHSSDEDANTDVFDAAKDDAPTQETPAR